MCFVVVSYCLPILHIHELPEEKKIKQNQTLKIYSELFLSISGHGCILERKKSVLCDVMVTHERETKGKY